MCVVNLYAVCVYVCGVWCVFAGVVCSCLLCEQVCGKDGVYNVYVYAFVYSTCVYNVFICSLCMHVPCVCVRGYVYMMCVEYMWVFAYICGVSWCVCVCVVCLYVVCMVCALRV